MDKTSEKLWEEEYHRKGIPSSFRQDPTKVVVSFYTFLQEKNIHQGKGIDLGCGKGRNTLFLAEKGYEMICLDLVKENLSEISQMAKQKHFLVHTYHQSVTQSWPVKKKELSFAIDVFCYKHIVDKKAQKRYRELLHSSLKDDGYYLLSLAADDDGFYGPLLKDSPDLSNKLVIDPFSHIGSFLYSLEEITKEFSEDFRVVHAQKISSASPMHGKEYTREVLSLIFQKR